MIRFKTSSVATAVVALVATTVAAADEPDIGPDAAASALFEEGRSLVDAGEWEAGCDSQYSARYTSVKSAAWHSRRS